MTLTYQDIITNLHQVKFAETSNLLSDYLHEINKPSFVKEHRIFYPQGIFTEKGLRNFYFFTDSKIAKVSFGKTIDTQVWKLSKILSYKLIIPSYEYLKLEIQLETGEVLKFDSEQDTNVNRARTMKEKIQDIFNLLEGI